MKSITLKNITHTYGKHTVLHDVTLSLPIGKMIAICGPSGCGKTTLLNIIGLLERPSRGSVQYDEGGSRKQQQSGEKAPLHNRLPVSKLRIVG